jgi:hypothetical protein
MVENETPFVEPAVYGRNLPWSPLLFALDPGAKVQERPVPQRFLEYPSRRRKNSTLIFPLVAGEM